MTDEANNKAGKRKAMKKSCGVGQVIERGTKTTGATRKAKKGSK